MAAKLENTMVDETDTSDCECEIEMLSVTSDSPDDLEDSDYEDDIAVGEVATDVTKVSLFNGLSGVCEEAIGEETMAVAQEPESFLESAKKMAREALGAALLGVRKEKDINTLKLGVKSTLLRAARSGELDSVLKKVSEAAQEDEMAGLKRRAREALLNAAQNGKLSAALPGREKTVETDEEENIEDLRRLARDTLLKAVQNGKLGTVLPNRKKEAVVEEEEEMEDLRRNALKTLLRGSQTGELAAALQSVKKKHQHADEEDEEDEEELRLKAKEALFAGMQNGGLEEIFAKREAQLKAEMRLKVRQTLLQSTTNGKLEHALSKLSESRKQKQEDIKEELRQNARQTLMKGVMNGKLEQALAMLPKKKNQEQKNADAEELQTLRQEALRTLLGAASNGQLDAALRNCKQPQMVQTPADLRKEALAVLSAGSLNGKLDAAFEKCAQRRKEKEAAEKKAEAEVLRQQAYKTLKDATLSGDLVAVIQKLKQRKATENLRSHLRSTLLQGASSGKFDEFIAMRENVDAEKLPEQEEQPMQEQELTDTEKEQLRLQVKSTLIQGSLSGKLGEFLSNQSSSKAMPETSLEDLKERARDVLLKRAHAAPTPILELKERAKEALLKAVAQKENVSEEDKLKSRVRSALVEAAGGRWLASALHKAAPRLTKFATLETKALPEPTMRALTPTRSRRRIIGGVVRAPALQQEEATSLSASPASVFRSNFGLKLDAAVGLQGAPAFDRPSSKSGKSRAASKTGFSAMDMDLGLAQGPTSTSAIDKTTPLMLRESIALMRSSVSMTTLPSMKTKQLPIGLLPSLGDKKHNSAAITQTMRMSKSASRSFGTGLRGSSSTSMIF